MINYMMKEISLPQIKIDLLFEAIVDKQRLWETDVFGKLANSIHLDLKILNYIQQL